jgi:hypothetical protein
MLTVPSTGPAQADGTRTLAGPGTGDPDLFMTFVGCDSLFTPGRAPQSRLNLGPYDAPLGRRSLGLVPPTAGTASGPFVRFDSLATLASSVSVAATSGSRGVSYVVAITATSPPGTAWSGRAPLTAAPGSWTTVSTADLTYDWTLVDLASLTPVSDAGSATAAAFSAEHGDGAGISVTGFGCDGRPFNLDAITGAGSTLDFEGTSLTTSLSVEREVVKDGTQVTVSGRVTDTAGRVTGDPLVLETRSPGGAWAAVGQPVLADGDGVARVDVPVTETVELRWHRPESQYADEGWSEPVTITVPSAQTDQTDPATGDPATEAPTSPDPATPDPGAPTQGPASDDPQDDPAG